MWYRICGLSDTWYRTCGIRHTVSDIWYREYRTLSACRSQAAQWDDGGGDGTCAQLGIGGSQEPCHAQLVRCRRAWVARRRRLCVERRAAIAHGGRVARNGDLRAVGTCDAPRGPMGA